MKKRILSILSAVMCMVLLFAALPMAASAEEGYSISLPEGLTLVNSRVPLSVELPDGSSASDYQVTLYKIVGGTPQYLDWGFLDKILERGGFGYYLGYDCGTVYRFCITDKGGTSPSTIYASTADIMAPHDLTEIPQEDANCSETGIKAYYECSGCHKLFSDSEGTKEITELDKWKAGEGKIEMLPHTYGEWKEDSETQHKRVCTNDASHVEYADHVWDEGKVTKEPTTEAEGEKLLTCTECGATKTESIDKLAPEKPADPKGDTPKTGDDFNAMLYVGIMLVCALAITAVVLIKKRRVTE